MEASAADVEFMTAMIHHHAQALQMGAWAATHGASSAVVALSERIAVGQRDEIDGAQAWLRRRNEPVPDVDGEHTTHGVAMDHASMPGMLSPEQLSQLDAATGEEFDRLFLMFMIHHHRGAVTMVEELFRARGAAQDDTVFRFATDVQADQLAEIDRMTRMLAGLPAAAN